MDLHLGWAGAKSMPTFKPLLVMINLGMVGDQGEFMKIHGIILLLFIILEIYFRLKSSYIIFHIYTVHKAEKIMTLAYFTIIIRYS